MTGQPTTPPKRTPQKNYQPRKNCDVFSRPFFLFSPLKGWCLSALIRQFLEKKPPPFASSKISIAPPRKKKKKKKKHHTGPPIPKNEKNQRLDLVVFP